MDFICALGKGKIINTINRNINISTTVDISVDSSVYRIIFGHLWELGHEKGPYGRFDERLIIPRLAIKMLYYRLPVRSMTS